MDAELIFHISRQCRSSYSETLTLLGHVFEIMAFRVNIIYRSLFWFFCQSSQEDTKEERYSTKDRSQRSASEASNSSQGSGTSSRKTSPQRDSQERGELHEKIFFLKRRENMSSSCLCPTSSSSLVYQSFGQRIDGLDWKEQ